MILKKTNSLSITDEERKEFKNRLSSLIENRGLSSFAKKCGLSEGTIRNLLKGDSLPRLDNLISIANTAGVTVEWLATGRGQMTYEATTDDISKLLMNVQESAAEYNKGANSSLDIIAKVSNQDRANRSDGMSFKKAEYPEGILTGKVSRIIELMIEYGLYKSEWRAHTNAFVHVYNESVGQGLNDRAVKIAILRTLIDQYEMTLARLEITAEKDTVDAEGIQPFIDDVKSSITELNQKLELESKGKLEVKSGGAFSF